jgi:hypothetical protein
VKIVTVGFVVLIGVAASAVQGAGNVESSQWNSLLNIALIILIGIIGWGLRAGFDRLVAKLDVLDISVRSIERALDRAGIDIPEKK